MSICGHLGFYNTATSRTRVRFSFTTHAAAGGNVAPNSAFEAADLRIYKATDGAAISATQRTSANGITMTSPFDSLTGVHSVDIDLTDNTDAGFYAAGCYYEVVLSPDETVDGQTITGVVLCAFDIGRPQTDVREFGGSAGTFASGRPDVNTTHAAGTAWNSGAIGANTLASDTIAAAKIAADAITAAKIADGAIDAATFAAGAINAAAIAADAITAAKIADGAIDAATFAAGAINAAAIANGAIDAATFAADVDAEILSYIVDDATRIDASALNTASGTSIPAILEDTGTTLQGELDGIQADTEDIQNRLPAALSSGRIVALAEVLGANSVDAAALAADAVTEIQSGLATAAALDTVDNFLDTEIAAIKAKTDQLTFTAANQVDANVQSVNDVTITGDGAGTPFGVS